MFAAGDGQRADDNAGEQNGLFTKYLVAEMQRPELNVRDMFFRVQQEGYDASSGRQEPYIYAGVVGNFAFRDAPQQSRQQSSPQTNFPTERTESANSSGSERQRVDVQAEGATKASSSTEAAANRIRVSGNVQAGKIINQVQPIYPPLARQTRISGTVGLRAIIAKDGTIQQLEVVSGHPLLLQAALNAVRQWRYQPTLLGGEPVEIDTTITVSFALQP
jgi:TonB family protein